MNRETLAAASLAATILLSGCTLAARQHLPETHQTPAEAPESGATPEMAPTPTLDVVAFCGPLAGSPAADAQMVALATIGVTSVHGYCHTPPDDYTVNQPGSRYGTQAEYLALAELAQRHRMGIIAYDPTFWTDPQRAVDVWAEYIADGTLQAVDLGDEPHTNDLAEMGRRAAIVRTTGVEPQTIFVGSAIQPLYEATQAVPTVCPTSDDYERNSQAMTDAFTLRAFAGCSGIAIDTTGRDLDGNGNLWSTDQITKARGAGFRITLFTGVQPENTPTWDALVDDAGNITPAGWAVREALL
jgi:hypothetical protein